jgi:tetratricopeptide (TPR) repeat protein
LQQIDSLVIIGEYDPEILNLYIEKTEKFRTNYPEDPFTAEYLFKAGLMAMTLAKNAEDLEGKELNSKKAISLFDDIQLIYPEFVGIKNCILNKGIIYYEILKDFENAEILYREYIARYPADTINSGVDSYLQCLGKSPEEIISEIERIKEKK